MGCWLEPPAVPCPVGLYLGQLPTWLTPSVRSKEKPIFWPHSIRNNSHHLCWILKSSHSVLLTLKGCTPEVTSVGAIWEPSTCKIHPPPPQAPDSHHATTRALGLEPHYWSQAGWVRLRSVILQVRLLQHRSSPPVDPQTRVTSWHTLMGRHRITILGHACSPREDRETQSSPRQPTLGRRDQTGPDPQEAARRLPATLPDRP